MPLKKFWCVFGCGGDRDATKRPLMAAMAQKYSDHIVVTSDNPRSESPSAIISQILLGFTRQDVQHESVHVQSDRALAIAQAITDAKPEDVVLLAGKGHETWQEMDGIKYPFEDQLHALAALKKRPRVGVSS
jgi:UDP-N-acetylmuramoyl-L-alanyl-D-glutamate--2,6-diaminopimelate ligase